MNNESRNSLSQIQPVPNLTYTLSAQDCPEPFIGLLSAKGLHLCLCRRGERSSIYLALYHLQELEGDDVAFRAPHARDFRME